MEGEREEGEEERKKERRKGGVKEMEGTREWGVGTGKGAVGRGKGEGLKNKVISKAINELK